MEVGIFMLTIGVIASSVLFAGGICLGDFRAEERYKKSFCRDRLCPFLHCGDTDLCHSDMGDSDRQEHSGQDRLPVAPDQEEVEAVLHYLRLGASDREKRVIDHLLGQEACDNE